MAGPLAGWSFLVAGEGAALAHASRLLGRLGAHLADAANDGIAGAVTDGSPPDVGAPWRVAAAEPYQAWAASGAMLLTGEESGPPRAPGWGIASAMAGAAAVFGLCTELLGCSIDIDGPALLGERAAHTGSRRHGTISPGGSCRLVAARDGWLAVNLPRPYDVDVVPAWLGCPIEPGVDPWSVVGREVTAGRVEPLEEQAILLGLPVAQLAPPTEGPPFGFDAAAPSATRPRRRQPLVVDLSSMWAGPLCANLLGLAGARVVKVESASRPDGARAGSRSFFDLLHAGHESVVLDFEDGAGLCALRRLLSAADVVIESSRARAMEQLGIVPFEIVAGGTTWVSVSAYGRTGRSRRWRNRVGFGDDVAVAAGLIAGPPDAPMFCGDGAADPVTGLHAAVAAAASLLADRSHFVDVSMRDAVASTVGGSRQAELLASPSDDGWAVDIGGVTVPVAAPHSRRTNGAARPYGADTDTVLGELACR